MNNWKATKRAKVPIYLLTILAIAVTIASSIILLLGYDEGIFPNNSYEDSRSYRSQISNTLWGCLSPLHYTVSWDGEEVPENIAFQSLPQFQEILDDYAIAYAPQSSNLQFKIVNRTTNEVLLDTFGDGNYGEIYSDQTSTLAIYGALQSPLTIDDNFATDATMFYQVQSLYPVIWYVIAVSLILSLIGLILVSICAGHKKGKEGITPGAWEKIPTDFGLLLSAAILVGGTAATAALSWDSWHSQNDIAYLVAMAALAIPFLLITSLTAVITVGTMTVRLKTSTASASTLVAMLLRQTRKGCHQLKILLQKLPILGRTALLALAIVLVNGLLGALSTAGFFGFILFAFYNLFLLLAICAIGLQAKLLQAGAQQLVKGNFQEKISTDRLYYDCKTHAETLNAIGDGIGLAVSEKIRSQNMKTELITNVSHDIKTPLTSIVTYVDLLQKDHTPQEQTEYLAVLQRQSMRMKKLVEDLVEASKASTGNLSVTLAETDLVEIVDQALAEYTDQLRSKNLTLVTTLPPTCPAQADGKLLWRVLDNLLSNVCKYAMSGTRVYVTVTPDSPREITIKNISAQPLNITAEELMERFVRGDQSRSTEGSGLGLNIAQSLMHLQNGALTLTVDGDFVKVQLTL